MRMKMSRLLFHAMLVQAFFPCAAWHAKAQAVAVPYPAMAPLNAYLIPDQASEIALSRSAAPPAISSAADVMVLGRTGYTVAVKGTNGFVCIVERSWGASTNEPEFWNPKVRAPICFNPPAARTFLPIYLMKTRLALSGKSNTEIVQATDSAFSRKELPALAPGAMCYMMSRQQYLNDRGKSWHPHLMRLRFGRRREKLGSRPAGYTDNLGQRS